MLDNIIHVWCLSITQPSTISVTTRSEFLNESESGGSGGSSDPETRCYCNESESGGSGGSSDPETRYNCNESESGGTRGSWRVLKHPEVSASIMLDSPNRVQKKLAISFLQERGQTKFRFCKKTFEYWFWIANIWIISADPKFFPQL